MKLPEKLRKIDDRAAAWEASLYLVAAAALILAVNLLRGFRPDDIFRNPIFVAVASAAFVFLLYWLLRHKASRNLSAVAVGAISMLLVISEVSGIMFLVVISNSMKHYENNYALYGFWESLGYSKENFSTFPASGGFQAGDMLVVAKTSDLKVGDVVVDVSDEVPITHRAFFVNSTVVKTAGDANPPQDASRIGNMRQRKDIYGRVWFVIPKGGILKALYNCYTSSGCDLSKCFNEGNCGSI